MNIRCLKNLFKQRPRIIKTMSIDPLFLSEEVLNQLAEDMKRIFPNPIRNGNRKRGRRAYGRIISYPISQKHREGTSWLYDDDEK